MLINIKKLTGTVIPLELEPSITIEEVKDIIAQKDGPPKENQKFIYRGKRLEDSKTLRDYDIEDGATIYLIMAMMH